MQERHRFDAIDQEQLAAQVVALMDAHFQRPSTDEKQQILKLAERQIRSQIGDARSSEVAQLRPSVRLVAANQKLDCYNKASQPQDQE